MIPTSVKELLEWKNSETNKIHFASRRGGGKEPLTFYATLNGNYIVELGGVMQGVTILYDGANPNEAVEIYNKNL